MGRVQHLPYGRVHLVEHRAEGKHDRDDHHRSLQDIGPDHRLESAHGSVQRRQSAHDQNADVFVDSGEVLHGDRRQIHDHGNTREHLRHREKRSPEHAQAGGEPAFEILVGRADLLPAQNGDEDEEADGQNQALQRTDEEELPVLRKSLGRHGHEADGTGPGGEHAHADREPGHLASPFEIGLGVAVAAGEKNTQGDHEQKIQKQSDVIGRVHGAARAEERPVNGKTAVTRNGNAKEIQPASIGQHAIDRVRQVAPYGPGIGDAVIGRDLLFFPGRTDKKEMGISGADDCHRLKISRWRCGCFPLSPRVFQTKRLVCPSKGEQDSVQMNQLAGRDRPFHRKRLALRPACLGPGEIEDENPLALGCCASFFHP